jgi:hypothetical protein
MKAWHIAVLCLICFAAGAALVFFIEGKIVDEELAGQVKEKDRLIAELTAAANDVKATSDRIKSIQDEMSKTAKDAEETRGSIQKGTQSLREKVLAYNAMVEEFIKKYKTVLSYLGSGEIQRFAGRSNIRVLRAFTGQIGSLIIGEREEDGRSGMEIRNHGIQGSGLRQTDQEAHLLRE